jgi:hypothetical protein
MEPTEEFNPCVACINHKPNEKMDARCWDCVGSTSRIYFEPREPKAPTPSALDKQVGGKHYKSVSSNMQPWEIARAWRLGAWRHGVLKYLLRCPDKNGIEDVEKAIHYLEYIKANYNELKTEGLL